MAFTQQEELNQAAKADNLDEVKSFFSADPDELPSQIDINNALEDAVKTESLNVIHYFFTESSPSPSQEGIAVAFITLCKSKNSTTLLPMIKRCIAEMTNKPKGEAINELLKATAKAMDWDYMRTLCELETDEAPSSEAVDTVVSTLLRGVGLQRNISLESSLKWINIQYLSNLKGVNKPTRTVIDNVLTTAIKAKSMDTDFKCQLLLQLCKMKSDNAPSREALVKILSVNPTLVKTPLILVKAACKHSKNRPNTEDVSNAIELLLKNAPIHWESVKYLCFKAPFTPDFAAIKATLAAALANDAVEIVKLFCEARHALLSQDDLKGALEHAKHHEEKEGHQSFNAAVLYLEQQLSNPADELEVIELGPDLSDPLKTYGFFPPRDLSQQQPKPQPTPTNSKDEEDLGCNLGELFCMGLYNCLAALYWAIVYLASCFPSCSTVEVDEEKLEGVPVNCY